MKKFLFLALIAAAFAGKAQAQQGYTRTPQGVQYRIVSPKTGDRIKLDDVVTFNMILKTERDSVIWNTYPQNKPIQFQVRPSQSVGDMLYMFPLLTVKDSAIVRMPADSVFKGHDEARPPFLPQGSLLVFTLKIERVQSMNEAIAERNAALAAEKARLEKLKTDELANLDKYVADHKLNVKTTTSGLQYEITQATAKPKIARGDTVWVNYAGRTVDDKLFDSSVESIAREGGLVQPGRNYEPISFTVGEGNVIKGWDEGLMLMSEGAKAILVIPSNLGYGAQAQGNSIPAYSTLVFDVEIVKVAKGKKKAAATAAKPGTTPAKKPATTPAKKPAVKK